MYCPYNHFVDEEEGFYYFYTRSNIEYRCFFTKHVSSNNILSLSLKNDVYTFDLVRFTKSDKSEYDRNVSATVGHIINLFFDKNPDLILSYICDNMDQKASKRQFSFSKWLKSFNREPLKVLISASLHDVFYAGVVLLHSHPEKDKIYSYFNSELDLLERETAKLGEVSIITN